MNKEEYRIVLGKMMQICSRREYCRFDIQEKLKKKKWTEEDIEQLIDQLLEERFIDEVRFCEAYVKDKYLFNKWGKNKIAFQLRQKRIQTKAIENALDTIDLDIYYQNLKSLIEAKARTIKTKGPMDFRQKLLRFLVQKGYEAQIVFELLDEMDYET